MQCCEVCFTCTQKKIPFQIYIYPVNEILLKQSIPQFLNKATYLTSFGGEVYFASVFSFNTQKIRL